MSSDAALLISIPFAIAGIAAFWFSITLRSLQSSEIDAKRAETENALTDIATDLMGSMRIELDAEFSAFDQGDDPLLLRVDPEKIEKSVNAFVKSMKEITLISGYASIVLKIADLSFWVAGLFAAAMLFSVATAAVGKEIGTRWADYGLVAGAVILFGAMVAALIYARAYRQLLAAEERARRHRLETNGLAS